MVGMIQKNIRLLPPPPGRSLSSWGRTQMIIFRAFKDEPKPWSYLSWFCNFRPFNLREQVPIFRGFCKGLTMAMFSDDILNHCGWLTRDWWFEIIATVASQLLPALLKGRLPNWGGDLEVFYQQKWISSFSTARGARRNAEDLTGTSHSGRCFWSILRGNGCWNYTSTMVQRSLQIVLERL